MEQINEIDQPDTFRTVGGFEHKRVDGKIVSRGAITGEEMDEAWLKGIVQALRRKSNAVGGGSVLLIRVRDNFKGLRTPDEFHDLVKLAVGRALSNSFDEVWFSGRCEGYWVELHGSVIRARISHDASGAN
jgi:hypothetical protein